MQLFYHSKCTAQTGSPHPNISTIYGIDNFCVKYAIAITFIGKSRPEEDL